MSEFVGNVMTVVVALWLYDRLKEWAQRRRYHG